jgi:hypothetical protein
MSTSFRCWFSAVMFNFIRRKAPAAFSSVASSSRRGSRRLCRRGPHDGRAIVFGSDDRAAAPCRSIRTCHSGRASRASPGEREPESSKQSGSCIHADRGLLVLGFGRSNHIAPSINLVLRGAHLILRRACPTWGARLEGLRASRRTATSETEPAAILRDARRAKRRAELLRMRPSRRRTASRLQPTCVLDVPISGKPEIGAPPQDEVWG